VYLDASVEERARRRWLEEQARGKEVDYDVVLASMRRRDGIDSTRQVSPLRVAEDAVVLDTTGLSIEDVLAEAERLVEEQGCRPD
ncbi:MAG: cytidylate kinase, partial [Chloroflexi bacterium]